MRPKNVSVSVIAEGDYVRVWGASFLLPIEGLLPRGKDGKIDEAARKRLEKRIAESLQIYPVDM